VNYNVGLRLRVSALANSAPAKMLVDLKNGNLKRHDKTTIAVHIKNALFGARFNADNVQDAEFKRELLDSVMASIFQ